MHSASSWKIYVHSCMVGPKILNPFVGCIRFPLGKVTPVNSFFLGLKGEIIAYRGLKYKCAHVVTSSVLSWAFGLSSIREAEEQRMYLYMVIWVEMFIRDCVASNSKTFFIFVVTAARS